MSKLIIIDIASLNAGYFDDFIAKRNYLFTNFVFESDQPADLDGLNVFARLLDENFNFEFRKTVYSVGQPLLPGFYLNALCFFSYLLSFFGFVRSFYLF
jgi:hypothetical protein